MAKHHEKVSLSEQLHPTWTGRPNFGRCIYQRVLEGKGTPFLHFLPRTKTITLGVTVSGVAVHHNMDVEDEKKGKTRSLESSPVRDVLPKPVVKPGTNSQSLEKGMRKQKSLDGFPRVKSMERRTPTSRPAKVGMSLRKSASWSQVKILELVSSRLKFEKVSVSWGFPWRYSYDIFFLSLVRSSEISWWCFTGAEENYV